MGKLDELKAHIRDLNLDLMIKDQDLSVDIKNRFNKRFRLFYPSRKLINFVIKSGGVLTGSRALRCYKLKGHDLFTRRVDDWDFIVTLEQAFKICSEMNINKIPEIDQVISIKNQRCWKHSSYSDSKRVGPVDVQLMIRDKLPDYNEYSGIRIASFEYSLSKKLEMIKILDEEFNQWKRDSENLNKHIIDIKSLIINFNNIKMNK
jgi:hypothetical protein